MIPVVIAAQEGDAPLVSDFLPPVVSSGKTQKTRNEYEILVLVDLLRSKSSAGFLFFSTIGLCGDLVED